MTQEYRFIIYLLIVYEIMADDGICRTVKCVRKCCPENQYLQGRFCSILNEKYSEETTDFSNVMVYEHRNHPTGRSVKDTFQLIPGYRIINGTFNNRSFDYSRLFNFYLTDEGVLYRELPNSYDRWFVYSDKEFCIDYRMTPTKFKSTFLSIVYDEAPPRNDIVLKCALIISCVFLFVVLVVYSILPELRNLSGMVLMAYIACLLGSFLILAALQLGRYDRSVCIGLSFSTYFLLLASFCWMNVLSYDIWQTFRGYVIAKPRRIPRRGQIIKLRKYCIYALGLPGLMTLMIVILNELDLKQKPWIITPMPDRECFFTGGQKLLYLYIPMLILILCNWVFYLMTAFNVRRIYRSTAVLDRTIDCTPAAHRSQWNRFKIYLKLTAVTGISWLLEVVSVLLPNVKLFYISDLYNIMFGLVIFLIFVCKKKILKKLMKRFNVSRGSPSVYTSKTSSRSKRSSNLEDTRSAQETPLQVFVKPSG